MTAISTLAILSSLTFITCKSEKSNSKSYDTASVDSSGYISEVKKQKSTGDSIVELYSPNGNDEHSNSLNSIDANSVKPVIEEDLNTIKDENYQTYEGKYTLDANQNWYDDNFTIIIDGNQLLYKKGNNTKTFEIKNQGIYSRTDNGMVFKYQKYYLVNKNQYLLVSHRKEIKHNGVFYYRIIIDGQTQLAL